MCISRYAWVIELYMYTDKIEVRKRYHTSRIRVVKVVPFRPVFSLVHLFVALTGHGAVSGVIKELFHA